MPPEPNTYDPVQLAKQTYLSAEEARDYLRFKTMKGLYHWVENYGVPKFRRGDRTLLFLRRDLDEAVGNFRNGRGRKRAPSIVGVDD